MPCLVIWQVRCACKPVCRCERSGAGTRRCSRSRCPSNQVLLFSWIPKQVPWCDISRPARSDPTLNYRTGAQGLLSWEPTTFLTLTFANRSEPNGSKHGSRWCQFAKLVLIEKGFYPSIVWMAHETAVRVICLIFGKSENIGGISQ